jgi:glycosyltransferase involved in cell wall biosynthesis
VRLCWDERTGIPAVLAQSPMRSHQPVVSGVIWITEDDAGLSPVARWTAGRAVRRTDAIFVHSSGQVWPLREQWGVSPARIYPIHFGIDTDFWDPLRPADAKGPGDGRSAGPLLSPPDQAIARVVSVGNDRHRDHGLIVSALRDVRSKLPQARLELVTRTPLHIPAEAGRWYKSLTHSQLRELYQGVQIAAVCTRPNNHASGLTAILEAMAMGKTVVATRTAGLEDYVTDGETGVLVPCGDRDALARALYDLLNDPGRCAQLGVQARERALRQFSTQAHARRLAVVLRSVL